MLSVEKVYDELYGMIEDLKKKIASISGGTMVTITPALDSGEKIADYTIDDLSGSIYAPIMALATTETKVGTFKGQDLYCKVVEIAAFPSTAYQATEYPHGITDMGDVVFTACNMLFEGTYAQLPLIAFTNSEIYRPATVTYQVDDTNIVIKAGTDRSGCSGTCIIYYTKTPPVPEAKKTRKK
jgi:hypothetical protein